MTLLGRRRTDVFGEVTPSYIPTGCFPGSPDYDYDDYGSLPEYRSGLSSGAETSAQTPWPPAEPHPFSSDTANMSRPVAPGQIALPQMPTSLPPRMNAVANFDRPLFDGAFSGPRSESRRERRLIGKWIMGADPGARPPTLSLNPYRTERGATVATPLVRMEPTHGREVPPGGYRTEVPKEAIDALNGAYAQGASEADLFNIAGRYRVRSTPRR
jgi:hypothetical protein